MTAKRADDAPGFTAKPWPPLRNGLLGVLRMHRPHTVYGFAEVDVTDALRALKRHQRALGVAVSFHAFILYCLARAAGEHRAVNTFRFRRRLIAFDDVDVGTTLEKRLAGFGRLPLLYVVRAANRKSLAEINWEFRSASRMNPADDPTTKLRRRLIALPAPLRRLLGYALSRNPFWLKRVHGTIGLTNLQRPGFDRPFVGLPPNIFTLTVAIGSLTDRILPGPEGQPAVRRVLCLSAGADHAVIDGMDLARFTERFTSLIASGAGLDEAFVAEGRRLKERAR